MKNLTKYVFTVGVPILVTVALLLSIGLMGSGCGDDKSNTASDTTPPTVAIVTPADLATDVPINRKIAAAFSEEMDPLTITTATFTIAQGTTLVPGTITYAGTAAAFTPTGDLAAGTVYTATIATEAMDLAGNALASAYIWSFTTGTISDTTPPTVAFADPADLATDVQINSKIVATFSEEMDPLTITSATFTIKQGTTPVSGAVTYAGTAATFTPAANLKTSTVYTATISTGAKDLAGNAPASAYVWSFTTGTTPDTTPPTVAIVAPADLATDVQINSKIVATFNEAIDPLTFTAAFTVKQGTTLVPGTITYAGTAATFTPAANLAAGTVYTATITTGAKDLAGNALASAYVWSFTTGTIPDTTPPTVAIVDPANLATDVPINKKIVATFNEAIDPLTFTAAFTVKQGTTLVPGTITYAGTAATFTPAANLAASTVYTATITTGAKDLAGNALASAYVWSFTTGTIPDTTPPTVVIVAPVNLATNVPINKKIAATFSEAMDPLTLTSATFTIKQGTTPVSGTVTYAGTIATFTPAGNFAAGTVYTATISTGAKDLAGNALASAYVWSFTTGTIPDTIPPTVAIVDPANLAPDVPINTKIAATFSEAMDPLTLTAAFTVKQGTTPVSGTVTYAGTVATFSPAGNLAAGTLYTATITTGAKDLAGNALANSYVWSFTTGASTHLGPAPVLLGQAGNFVILSKSGIDTIPTSAITGNIGVSPIDSTGITGFSLIADSSNVFSKSTQVTGQVFAADYAVPTPDNMTTAISDMETAFTDAAGRPTPDFTELGAGNISGLTLVPGLYKWGTGVLISSDVTIKGGPNDVWIFQIAGGITQASATKVILAGGALAKNIFWQAFGAVALDTTAHLEGVVLSQTEITLATGASVNGRLLAQTAVTLDASTVTQPAP